MHREYFAGNEDAEMPADPRYRPGLAACGADGCGCEIDGAV